jgi:CheY-like chemotaxis protein/HPt (histidine-containing phosphotransfer) domain-containing protein
MAVCLTKPVRQVHLYNCLRTVLGAAAAPAVAAPRSPLWQAAQVQIHARVLVVDDNTVNQKVAVRQLEKLGCRTDVAANGREAVDVLCRLAYDLVLMDCQMPEMDGFAATAAVRQGEAGTGRHVPIIAMTANALQGDRERCLAAGMDDYLSKPVQSEALLAMVQKWVPSLAEAVFQPPSPAAPTPPVARAVQAPALDLAIFAALQALGDDDPLFLPGIIEQFVHDAAAHLATLHLAADTGDARTLERTAHTLKSISATLGATGMTALCGELQKLGRADSLTGAAACIEQLGCECARVQQALTQICPQLYNPVSPLPG